ncbi:MAG: CUB domain-containing protein [Bacteroidota bacterium]
MGETAETSNCSGTLFDSGGATGDYGNNEALGFKICPTDPHQCISLSIENFEIENNEDGLTIHAGEDVSAPTIAAITGSSNGNDFEVQASSNCVFIAFTSDEFITNAGFEISWQCSNAPCDARSLDDITFIPSIPFSRNNESTCGNASTFAEGPSCPSISFLGGPENIYQYNSVGEECISIALNNADPSTGILLLNKLPNDPTALCVASSVEGRVNGAKLQLPGTYYIVVANADGCADYDISIETTDCNLSPSLINAICNPINNCASARPGTNDPLPTTLFFDDGFQDIAVTTGQNNGCWDLSMGLGLNVQTFTGSVLKHWPMATSVSLSKVPMCLLIWTSTYGGLSLLQMPVTIHKL